MLRCQKITLRQLDIMLLLRYARYAQKTMRARRMMSCCWRVRVMYTRDYYVTAVRGSRYVARRARYTLYVAPQRRCCVMPPRKKDMPLLMLLLLVDDTTPPCRRHVTPSLIFTPRLRFAMPDSPSPPMPCFMVLPRYFAAAALIR